MRIFLYGLIALSPLPFASARPVWEWFWVLIVGIAAVVYLVQSRGTAPIKWSTAAKAAIIGISVFVLWGFIQAFLPLGVVSSIGVDVVDNILLQKGYVSVDPAKTTAITLYFLSHLVFFILVYAYCSRRAKAVNFIRFCGVICALYAAYGFIVFVSGNDTILWFERWTGSNASLTSTFVGRNGFAAYAGIGLQCLIAYAVFWTQDELAEGRTGRELYRHVLETMLTKAWWLPLAILVTAVALLLTNSRAGFGSVAVATVLLFTISPNRYGVKKIGWKNLASAAMLIAIGVGVFSLSGDVLENRLQSGAGLDLRLSVYSLVIDAIIDKPLMGFGLGTFDEVFRLYRDETILGNFTRAHNDYLELAMTAGIPATTLLVTSILAVIVILCASLKYGNQYRSFIALGITVSAQLGLHSLVDFSMQKPAVSYLWCAVVASSLAMAYRCKRAADSANAEG